MNVIVLLEAEILPIKRCVQMMRHISVCGLPLHPVFWLYIYCEWRCRQGVGDIESFDWVRFGRWANLKKLRQTSTDSYPLETVLCTNHPSCLHFLYSNQHNSAESIPFHNSQYAIKLSFWFDYLGHWRYRHRLGYSNFKCRAIHYFSCLSHLQSS